jgi:hypothetical protein
MAAPLAAHVAGLLASRQIVAPLPTSLPCIASALRLDVLTVRSSLQNLRRVVDILLPLLILTSAPLAMAGLRAASREPGARPTRP